MQRRGSIGVVLLVCGIALGQAPVGPSTAVLEGTRFGVSGEYAWTDADIHFTDKTKESHDFQTSYAGFAVALTDRWDFFVRLGGSQADDTGFHGDWSVSWGLGTRITALKWHDWSWGVLGQFTNIVSDYDTVALFDVSGTPTALPATEELNLAEYVFATGPTWQHGPLSLYGGLLLRYITGELEAHANSRHVSGQVDVHARVDPGGYLGGRIALFRTDPAQTSGLSRCDLTVEGRFTGDSKGFSVGLLLPFGGGV
jgi:hypothetical protein